MSNPERGRNLAAFHAAVASEIAGTRTMSLVVSSTAGADEMLQHIDAWLHDWREYQVEQAGNALVKAAITTAVDNLNRAHIAAAVRHIHFEQWNAEAREVSLAMAVGAERQGIPRPAVSAATRTGLNISLPGALSPKRPSTIEVQGQPRKVAACICAVLRQIRDGQAQLRIRPEVVMAIERDLRELLPFLRRDESRKVDRKAALYRVLDGFAVV